MNEYLDDYCGVATYLNTFFSTGIRADNVIKYQDIFDDESLSLEGRLRILKQHEREYKLRKLIMCRALKKVLKHCNLSSEEAELLQYVANGMKQSDIGSIFNKDQSTIVYRIKQIVKRIRLNLIKYGGTWVYPML